MSTSTHKTFLAVVILCLPTASLGIEPLSISHSMTSYTVDGPSASFTLTLQLVNNTTTVLSGTAIRTAPMGPLAKDLGLILERPAMQVGDIPAAGAISVDYTIESAHSLSEAAIGHLPVFWEVGYIDQAGQQQRTVLRSEAPFSEPEQTAETASAPVVALAGSGVIERWVATYNGPGNYADTPIGVAVDASGNVYVTGNSYGSGTDCDFAVVKYDSSGKELWVARYNGGGNLRDYASAMALDASGNIYVTGTSTNTYGNSDFATVKYSSSGKELWVARYNGPENHGDGAAAMTLDASNNVYVTGCSYKNPYSDPDFTTVKYDSSGNELWVARYTGPENWIDAAHAIAVDATGNVYVTGSSANNTNVHNCDYVTVKYDSSGNELWVTRYNGPAFLYGFDSPYAIAVDPSGDVYVTGRSYGDGTNYDCATVKYDTNGNELWVARYNGSGNSQDTAFAMALDASGNVYVTGYSHGSTYEDYATIKYDASGNELWVAKYNGPGNIWDRAEAMALDASGNVYVTGYSYGGVNGYDYATVKYDSSGNELWVARYDSTAFYDYARALALDASGNVYVTGTSEDSSSGYDYATVKYIPLENPPGAIQALITAVVSLNLQNGIANSLDAKLEAAFNALDDVKTNNDGAAINTLEAFINAVDAQRGKEVSELDADGLIQAAVNIINMLSGP